MIEEIYLLFSLKIRILLNLLKSFSFWKRVSLPFIFAAILFFIIYYFFYRFFYFLNKVPVLGIIVSQKFVDFTLMSIFFFLVLSNIVSSFSIFFEDEEFSFLFRFPLKKESIFVIKFFEIIIYSSWVPLIFLIPLLFSYVTIFEIKKAKLILLSFNFVFYIISAGLVGIFLFYFFVRLSPTLKKEILPFFFGILFLLFIYLYLRFGKPQLFKVFDVKSIDEAVYILKQVGTMSPSLLPSNWFFSSLIGNKDTFTVFLLLLTFNLLLATILTVLPFEKVHYKSFLKEKAQGGRNPKFILLQKEFKSFYRNYSQISQFIFLILLFLLYVISVRGKGLGINIPIWHVIIIYSNFVFVVYLLITIAVRFIYPVASVEERGVSLFYLAGEDPLKLFSFQLILYFILLSFMGYLLFFSTHFSLKVLYFKDLTLIFISLLPFIIFSITFLALSIGYIFPQFDEKNPAKIASGPGAFLTASILILYLLISGFILFQKPLQKYYYGIETQFFPYILIFLLFSIILLTIFFKALKDKIKKMEF
ncbi:MAG: hypothetical protein ABDH49_00390 [Candidatus Hydrothermales bacterium]